MAIDEGEGGGGSDADTPSEASAQEVEGGPEPAAESVSEEAEGGPQAEVGPEGSASLPSPRTRLASLMAAVSSAVFEAEEATATLATRPSTALLQAREQEA